MCPAPVTGWGLVELMVGLALAGILSTLAWPGYESQLQRLRRADGVAALARLQQAQEHHRSRAAVYAAGLDDDGLALPSTSEAGHYRLAVGTDAASAAAGYRIEAIAVGRQADDRACRHLAVELDQGRLRRRSGPDGSLANDASDNRRCWGRW
ncbi:type IV pilin protein [Sphaerotilus mobilis]|nr:type IV pilin protein [Sphaerotilus mobilis]